MTITPEEIVAAHAKGSWDGAVVPWDEQVRILIAAYEAQRAELERLRAESDMNYSMAFAAAVEAERAEIAELIEKYASQTQTLMRFMDREAAAIEAERQACEDIARKEEVANGTPAAHRIKAAIAARKNRA